MTSEASLRGIARHHYQGSLETEEDVKMCEHISIRKHDMLLIIERSRRNLDITNILFQLNH
jgi:hypothetical protein